MGRATETVRYTLRNWDREHPDQPLFPTVTGPFDPATKQMIFNSFRRGITVNNLAKSFQRTASSMYRVIHEIRAQRLMDQKLEFIDNPTFADEVATMPSILADMPGADEFDKARRSMRIPKDAPPELTSLYQVPLLTKEQEQHLFRKMNYLKFKAAQLLEGMMLPTRPHRLPRGPHPGSRSDREAPEGSERRQGSAHQLQHAARGLDREEALGPDRQLLRAALRRQHVADPRRREVRLRPRQQVQHLRELGDHEELRPQHPRREDSPRTLRRRARKNSSTSPRTTAPTNGNAWPSPNRRATRSTACSSTSSRANAKSSACGPASKHGAAAMTLEKIGEKLGITKERVRQLNVRAMKKLRSLVETQKNDV